jgi:hypothetical protein
MEKAVLAIRVAPFTPKGLLLLLLHASMMFVDIPLLHLAKAGPIPPSAAPLMLLLLLLLLLHTRTNGGQRIRANHG